MGTRSRRRSNVFSGIGLITYDNLSIGGYRTCSITMMMPGMAQDFYNLLISVKDRANINLGFTMRTVDANYISLVADFLDKNMYLLKNLENPITKEVTHEFKSVISKFIVPVGAESVRLSVKFVGKITAYTYYAPVAFYS